MLSISNDYFAESSIHGVKYINKRELHWAERCLWGLVVVSATVYTGFICRDQWRRFASNPIVYAVEINSNTREIPFVAITMCSNFSNHHANARIIQKYFDVSESTAPNEFHYYMDFLNTLKDVHYNNMQVLEPYVNNTKIRSVSLLNITIDIKKPLVQQERETETTVLLLDKLRYAMVITEMGVCFSTSEANEYQNPYRLVRVNTSQHEICRPLDVCTLKISPANADAAYVEFVSLFCTVCFFCRFTDYLILQYMHEASEVATFDRSAIKRTLIGNKTDDVDLQMELTLAEEEVRSLPINFRKCRFENENNLAYFKTYKQTHCFIECRITEALKLCNCKPFFYVIGEGKTCDIGEMQCLAHRNWSTTSTECFLHCFPLCEQISYSELKKPDYNYVGLMMIFCLRLCRVVVFLFLSCFFFWE